MPIYLLPLADCGANLAKILHLVSTTYTKYGSINKNDIQVINLAKKFPN